MSARTSTLAKAAVLAAMVTGYVAIATSASAGSDSPPPYTVTAAGVTLPAGVTFPAHGHVNVKIATTAGGERRQDVHLDPNNGQPGGAYIGLAFYPVHLEPGECITWVQVSFYDEHFGDGGQAPVCAPALPPVDVEPTPEPTPEPTDKPTTPHTIDPTEEPTWTPPTDEPSPTPSESVPAETPDAELEPKPSPSASSAPAATVTKPSTTSSAPATAPSTAASSVLKSTSPAPAPPSTASPASPALAATGTDGLVWLTTAALTLLLVGYLLVTRRNR